MTLIDGQLLLVSTDENNVRQYKLNEAEPEQSQFVDIADVFKENEQFV